MKFSVRVNSKENIFFKHGKTTDSCSVAKGFHRFKTMGTINKTSDNLGRILSLESKIVDTIFVLINTDTELEQLQATSDLLSSLQDVKDSK